MKIATETKVGVLAIIAIAALVLGFDFLKGNNTFEKGRTFFVVYDRVPGLQTSDPVKMNDLLVGRVKSLELRKDYTILARLNITDDFIIPSDSKAEISSSDLLGAKQVDLVIGESPINARSRDTLTGTIEKGLQEEIQEQLKPITDRVQNLIAQLDSSVIVIAGIFGGTTPRNVERSFTSVSETLDNFSRTSLRIDGLVTDESDRIDSIFANLETVTASFAENTGEIDRIMRNMANFSDSLAALQLVQMVASAKDAIDALGSVASSVEAGEGTLGKLLVDETLYDNLSNSSKDLDLLLRDIQENPGRYVTLIRIGGGKKR